MISLTLDMTFIWLKFMRFNSSSDFPKKLDGFLKFNTDCLRFLITKTSNALDEVTPQVNKES